MVDGEPAPDSTDAPASRWARIATVLAVAVLAPAVLVAIVIVRNPTYSPLDEHAHSDYLRRIEQGEIPRVGDLVLQETVADVQCRTQRGQRAQPCGLPSYDPAIVGAAGYQYEAQQPPAYYAVTALLRQVARIGPVDSFLVSARLTGIAWLSAGLLVFFAACRRLGCRWWPTTTATFLLGMGPGVLYQSAAVNNDAAAILTGSLALLMFAQLRDATGRGRIALWCAVAVALVLVKPTGVIAIGAACGALLLDAWLDRRLTPRLGLALGAPVLAGLVTYLAWGVVREARATIDYDVVLEALLSFKMTDQVPLDDTVRNLTKLLQSYAPPGCRSSRRRWRPRPRSCSACSSRRRRPASGCGAGARRPSGWLASACWPRWPPVPPSRSSSTWTTPWTEARRPGTG